LTRRSVGETVVENLRVLAIDALDPKASAANPTNGNFGRTVTLEVTSEEVEQINVAAELGKLSVALRSITGPTTLAAVSPIDNTDQVVKHGGHVKPTWAGDVSPALYGAAEPRPVAVTKPPIQVFHGAGKDGQGTNVRAETVKTEE
jgi:pilus assembly protein CpaB